jgi:hypothetical protein
VPSSSETFSSTTEKQGVSCSFSVSVAQNVVAAVQLIVSTGKLLVSIPTTFSLRNGLDPVAELLDGYFPISSAYSY